MTTQRTALVVEDDPFYARVLIRMLEELDFEVAWVGDASTARETIASREFSVYSLDLKLPGGGGDAVIELLRLRPDRARRSVILTAYPLMASAFAGEIPILDKADFSGLKRFVSGLEPSC